MTDYLWRPPAINGGWENVLRSLGIVVTKVEPFGPMGLQATIRSPLYRTEGEDVGSIIISQADHDGDEWVHASIAYRDRDPTYSELVMLHRAVFGRRRFAYQQFLPEADHVNIHEHALHLWGRADGRPVMPYGTEGTV